MLAPRLHHFLDERHASYTTLTHDRTVTAQQTASAAHIGQRHFAKTVMLQVEGKLAMLEMPSMFRVDLARLSRAQDQWPQAENYLHRAIAQGAGSEAWEELGHGFAEHGEEALARKCYANALRAGRGEPAVELPGRDLRQQISDSAAMEDRNEHGFPRLRE